MQAQEDVQGDQTVAQLSGALCPSQVLRSIGKNNISLLHSNEESTCPSLRRGGNSTSGIA